jgi:hypothetical protein
MWPSQMPILGGKQLTARDIEVIRLFCDQVERIAEQNMLKTGKLEGSHYAAMRKLLVQIGPVPDDAVTAARETARRIALRLGAT